MGNKSLLIGNHLIRIKIKRKNVVKFLLNYPRLTLHYTPDRLKRKIGFITKVMRLPFSMLIANPVILSYSLDRICTRLDYARTNHSLAFWIQPTDEMFIKGCICHETCDEYFNLSNNRIDRYIGEE